GNGFPNKQDYGNSLVKLNASANSMSVADYFTMSNNLAESNSDGDLGSGAPMVLPPQSNGSGGNLNLVVVAGKDSNIYVADQTNMGKFNSSSDQIFQELDDALPSGVWGVPAYFNGTVYYCSQLNPLRAFTVTNGMLTTPSATTAMFSYPGALPSISAN